MSVSLIGNATDDGRGFTVTKDGGQ